MAEFFVETQCWAHWPKVLVMGRNRNDGTVERRRYVPERTCKMETDYDELEVVACSPEDTWAYKCSACDWSFRYDRGIKPNYCPICGCKAVD
jgi:hypothetical protein